MLKAQDIVYPTSAGLYCAPGDFHIDPHLPVDRALITHGHSDHARAGHGAVLASAETCDIMKIRLGDAGAGAFQAASLRKPMDVNGVTVTFCPAGHVLGSCQILLEHKGVRICVSGDYKRQHDPTAVPFEPVSCDVFITEATFGLPVFVHPDPYAQTARLIASLEAQPDRDLFVGAYSLGKAQRMIAMLRELGHDSPIYLHGSMTSLCDYYQSRGIALGTLENGTQAARSWSGRGSIVIGPPSAMASAWLNRWRDPVLACASGWMRIRQRAKRAGVELPLVISDHCDWPDLQRSITETGAGEIWVTHGSEEALVHWCASQGLSARPLRLVGFAEEGD